MNDNYDIIVIGAGPGGATAAIVAARAGLKVCVLEKSQHPKFHIGETLLPKLMELLDELGLEGEMRKLPHVPKVGAEFCIGNDPRAMRFFFSQALVPTVPVFNIERCHFDNMLVEQARIAGAEVYENTPVKEIVRLEENNVEVAIEGRTIKGRMILDASGHGTVVGRHLKQRKNFDDPDLQKVAYFAHFENVDTSTPERHPTIFMCDEGWFWLIPLTDKKMSIGFTTRPSFVKQVDVPPNRLLKWAMERCPQLQLRMKNATGPINNDVLADFSYTCKPFAGPGYFMVGDAGCFLDPIFSTCVTLAMYGGMEAAKHTIGIFNGTQNVAKARKTYSKMITESTKPFWKIIKNYYRKSFRELFMEGQGPLQVHRAIFAVLAGHVFPKPAWKLRWRLQFFWFSMWLQDHFGVAPRRPVCSVLTETPVEMPWIYEPAMQTQVA
ncbi:NAD(P)/FAD-dependent oxidoreductase [soil metagenome]